MQTELKRELKSRHLSMIAIGGSIGTGLFVASGATIAQAGPGGALLSYILIGIMVFFLMNSLGELASYLPVSGTFSTYGSRYVDDSFGFAVGWNYWYNWAITVAADIVAAQVLIAYWGDFGGYAWMFNFLFLGIMFLLNAISVKGFGEAEFWFALIKVLTVVIFIVVGVIMILGVFYDDPSIGWHNWTLDDAPFHGGFAAMIGVAMIVGFSFQGTELIGIAAGESEDPEKSIPRSIKHVFWRILLFYILTIFVISLIIPYTDNQLLKGGEDNVAMSPFTLVFERAGFLSVAAVLNAVILTSVLSAGNSGLYASTRMLYALAKEGKAPKIFSRITRFGVPIYALLATTIVAMLCFFTTAISNAKVYEWLLNLSGMTGFIAWLAIALSHYRFRRGYVKQGRNLDDLPFKSPFFPFAPLFAFIICLTITLGQNYEAFLADTIDWSGVIATYVGIPLFLIILFTHKIVKKTKWIRYDEMDFSRIPKNSKQDVFVPDISELN